MYVVGEKSEKAIVVLPDLFGMNSGMYGMTGVVTINAQGGKEFFRLILWFVLAQGVRSSSVIGSRKKVSSW